MYQRTNRNSFGQFLRSRERFRFISHGLEPIMAKVGPPGREVEVQIGWKFDRPKGVTRYTDEAAFLAHGGTLNSHIALDPQPGFSIADLEALHRMGVRHE